LRDRRCGENSSIRSTGQEPIVLAHDAEPNRPRRQDVSKVSVAEIRTPAMIIVAQDDYITPSYHAHSLRSATPGSPL
jgi:pimeloyl-ACP methyl ester carboxylesterase